MARKSSLPEQNLSQERHWDITLRTARECAIPLPLQGADTDGGLGSNFPERSDDFGACLQKRFNFSAEGIRFFAFNVNRADHTPSLTIKHRNNDFGPRGTQCGQITGISGDVSNIDNFLLCNRCTGQPLGKRESGMFGSTRPTPDDVRHNSTRVVHLIEADPAIFGVTSYQVSSLLERGYTIPSDRDKVTEIG